MFKIQIKLELLMILDCSIVISVNVDTPGVVEIFITVVLDSHVYFFN